MRNKWTWIIILILLLGGMSGVLFNRFVIPWAAGQSGFSWLRNLESNNPVVINRKEEVQLNEGANYLDLANQAASYTVNVYSQTQGAYKFLGNGIITSADGMVVTSKAILGTGSDFTVVTNDGTTYAATLRALDPRSEVAVLTISANNLPVAQFANAGDLNISQRLIYIGRSNKEFTREFDSGFVTNSLANNESLNEVMDSEAFEQTISSDAKISPDFVGGPILDLDGKVVGMTTSNLSVLIGEDLSTAVNSYLKNGKIQRPSFGIKYLNLSTMLGKLKNLPQGGVLVVSVDDASPAKQGGLLANDLIISADNQQLPQNNFEQILNRHDFTDMPVTVLRNGSQVNLTVKLEPK